MCSICVYFTYTHIYVSKVTCFLDAYRVLWYTDHVKLGQHKNQRLLRQLIVKAVSVTQGLHKLFSFIIAPFTLCLTCPLYLTFH